MWRCSVFMAQLKPFVQLNYDANVLGSLILKWLQLDSKHPVYLATVPSPKQSETLARTCKYYARNFKYSLAGYVTYVDLQDDVPARLLSTAELFVKCFGSLFMQTSAA